VLVADAAANALLVVSARGEVDWVAVLPPKLLPFMGNMIPAQPVATSIAVGPDGAYYVGELTGFPATPGNSLVWRIEAGTRRTVCPSASCAAVVEGLTSIMDLEFGPDGTLYVVELDQASWLATAGGTAPAAGGAVKACDVDAGTCSIVASGLDLPSGIAVAADGTIWIAENESIPGVAHVHALGS
jgi:sugar lactone lactonase YvrE